MSAGHETEALRRGRDALGRRAWAEAVLLGRACRALRAGVTGARRRGDVTFDLAERGGTLHTNHCGPWRVTRTRPASASP